MSSKKLSPWLKKLPNRLTYLRIICIPFIVYLLTLSSVGEESIFFWRITPEIPTVTDIIAATLFALAAITDFFDGYIARRYNIETTLGKLLDPLADKLLVVAALIILVEKHRLFGWIAVFLIVRDLAINAIRLSAIEDGIHIASSALGKYKTFFLDIGIFCLIIYGWLIYIPFHIVGAVFVILAVISSFLSALQYLAIYAINLNKPQSKNKK